MYAIYQNLISKFDSESLHNYIVILGIAWLAQESGLIIPWQITCTAVAGVYFKNAMEKLAARKP